MATFRDNYALGVDVSAYNPVVEWHTLKQGGVSFAFARSSYGVNKDNSFAGHVQGAYDAGIPMLAYHALEPGYYFNALQTLDKANDMDKWLPASMDAQFQAMKQSLSYKKLYGLAVDFELVKDWNGNVLPDIWLWTILKQFCKRVKAAFPQYPLMVYTGGWVVWSYCKTIENMGGVPDTFLWVAYYPYDTTVISTNWDELKKYYPPETMTISFPDGKRQTQNPPFLGWSGWKFWQFSGDKFKLPGVKNAQGKPSAVDLNFYNGTKEQLYQFLGFTEQSSSGSTGGGGEVQPSVPSDDSGLLQSIDGTLKQILALLKDVYKR